ncbi:hypothetical protein [Gramella sp. AN32]|uniref:Uncharacterized protein n=1 Tax=Christiangramia antarctica TaxID=2058158 RepID=A0ABW5X865_9FLAO|nr:hypothetical protein [Gramella sp. AN32]
MNRNSEKYLILISKIIFFYCTFYVIMKILAIFQGAWVAPSLVLAIPYLAFAIAGAYMVKTDNYSWIYVIAGVILISVVRYYEKIWMLQLHNYFN